MDVQARRDRAVAVVLDVRELVRQRVRLVVVDQGENAHRLAGPRRPFLLDELAPEQIAHELAAVAVAPAGAQPIQRAHQAGRQRDGKADRAFLSHRTEMYWIHGGPCDITFSPMLILSDAARPSVIVGLVLLGVLVAPAANGQEPPPRAQEAPPRTEETTLPPVVVTAPPPVSASSEVFIPGLDFELRPQGRPADVVRLIPGFVISQHQGGGKAEQYFLRGFDADHGTDVALFVDGMPVNLRSHAHGQGYADLHFLIPETVKVVDGLKGPYFVEFGDFATAGAVNFVTKDLVDANTVEVAGGMFNTQRYLTLLSPTRDALKSLVAIDAYRSDGPFEHGNGYERFNIFAKASASLAEGMDLSLWASHYRADWHGSGQIPLRAVREGLISRFGAIDPNEGGQTQRTNLNLDWRWRPSERQLLSVHAYGTYYSLSLFNNFTFFLNNPDHGDEINQRDRRVLAGVDTQYAHRSEPLGVSVTTTGGLQYRLDTPHIVLANTAERHLLDRVQDAEVIEQSYSPFLKFDLAPLAWLRLVTGARGDIFTYHVSSKVNSAGGDLNGDVTRARPNVKANVILGPWSQTELFANFGTGFHSNDARAVILDPKLPALPTARGWELGIKTKVLPRVELSATYWVLDLASELVFIGDDGTTEARGPSHREGWEFATRVKLLEWLTFSGDVTTSRATFDTGAAVPLAPRVTGRADLAARLPWGFAASLGMRHLGDRFADEG